MSAKNGSTLAWQIWHTARVEDLVANFLIGMGDEVLTDELLGKVNYNLRDTGNSMSKKEIEIFRREINLECLFKYSDLVGMRTRKILKSLTPEDALRKPDLKGLSRIVQTGVLLVDKDSIWLKEFWGKKTVEGLIYLPLTNHYIMHFEKSIKIIDKINSM